MTATEATRKNLEDYPAPPPEQLTELIELARMGNMRKIQVWATQLAERDSACNAFAERLRHLASGFKANAILALVEHHMRERK